MKREYDFSKGTKNPYAKMLKEQDAINSVSGNILVVYCKAILFENVDYFAIKISTYWKRAQKMIKFGHEVKICTSCH